MANDKSRQRAFILGSALEFVGIVALAIRFGGDIGGSAVLMIGSATLAIGIAFTVRAIVLALRAPLDADARNDG